jgi:hypothetical protein
MKRVTPLALLLAAAGALEAQQVPTVTLPRASATFSEPFTQIVGLRELPDGRVILADPRERTLALLDFRSGQATRIGREGQGPGEWRLPNGVYALPGDSTLVFDVGNMRYLVVDPKGQPAYTFSLIGDGAPGGGQRAVAPGGQRTPPPGGQRSPAPGGQRAQRGPGGPGGPGMAGGAMASVLRPPSGVDAQGRLYFASSPFRMGPDGPVAVDSIEITRVDRENDRVDTIARIHVPGTQVTAGQQGTNTMRLAVRMSGPFEARDEWAVAPDGRIAVVRHSPFRVEWVAPAGTVTRGPEQPYTPIPVTDADREAVAEARRSAGGMRVMMGPGGTQVTMGGQAADAPPMDDTEDWPDTKPPFSAGAARIAPNGHLWLLRSRRADDPVPVYDVFDGAGRLIRRVALPRDTRLVGFGARSVYLVRTDDSDLQYLERVDAPELLGAR